MVETNDSHALFGVIDEEEYVSGCINLIVNEDVKEIVGTCRVNESVDNHTIGKLLWRASNHDSI